jgi:hypothetical protein
MIAKLIIVSLNILLEIGTDEEGHRQSPYLELKSFSAILVYF